MQPAQHPVCRVVAAAFLIGLWFASQVAAQTGDDYDDPFVDYATGLAKSVEFADGTRLVRRAPRPFSTAAMPAASGEFRSIAWSGLLRVSDVGPLRIHLACDGEFELILGEHAFAGRHGATVRRWTSPPLDLRADDLSFTLVWRPGREKLLKLGWSGPRFSPEPPPERAWRLSPDDARLLQLDRGEQLIDAHRCVACHEGGSPRTLPAPSLKVLAGSVAPDWLREHLSESTPSAQRRMPEFALSPDQVDALVAYLTSGESVASSPEDVTVNRDREPDAKAGERLVHRRGCLACHTLGDLGSGGLYGGGNLSRVRFKRPAEFAEQLLADPASLGGDRRMPKLDLSPAEIRDITAFLCGTEDGAAAPDFAVADSRTEAVATGRELAASLRCHACHELPDEADASTRTLIPASADWTDSCLQAPRGVRPGYRFDHADVEAIRAAWATADNTNAPQADAELALGRRNCLACHARGEQRGLRPVVEQIALVAPDSASEPAELLPPSLSSIGDKLQDAELRAAVAGERRRRAWLAPSMPHFRYDEGEAELLAEYLIAADRGAEWTPAEKPLADAASLAAAGGRLVTAEGFGCTSCHAIGDQSPSQVDPAALGPDLSNLGARVRRPWFDRWVRGPARITPGMEMPAVQIPTAGVLHDRLDDQLAAVWEVLNTPGFQPLPANPLRVVRARNLPEAPERAVLLTDVLRIGERRMVKPALIALGNRHNVLLDLEANRLAAWWIGDAAAERTEGKTWFWSPAGSYLWKPDGASRGELGRVRGDLVHYPVKRGQFVTELDAWRHDGLGLELQHRLQFTPAASDGGQPIEVTVRQTFHPTPEGFVRAVSLSGPPGEQFLLHLAPNDGWNPAGDGGAVHAASHTSIEPSGDEGLQVVDGRPQLELVLGERGQANCEVRYGAAVLVDQYLTPTPPTPLADEVAVDLVPGFAGRQLPLPQRIMPTALAWNDRGQMAVCSLEGRVWLARDTNGDGCEDVAAPLSDELAAPYGVAAAGEAWDVVNKTALLRLVDEDGDGRADRTVTLASGWGHTDDYHDWAVGLPRDSDGRYYVALPCQQDDRSAEAARYRGQLLRLTPPPGDDAAVGARWSIEPWCGGLRFPMGLVLTPEGEIFASDNQGNYNPFNELNHLQRGRRFGFINELERRAGIAPPFEPPAIALPHPWVRSVNGLCLLASPPSAAASFGPFEGHLVGCEFNERLLVRMTLEQVDGVYQGAVYPLSLPATGDDVFEGPITCAVSPAGALYVGSLIDSGWGGGANTGSMVQLIPTGDWPPGIAEVRATADGFLVRLTPAADRDAMLADAEFRVESFRRVSTPAYGGDDQDRRREPIAEVAPGDADDEIRLRLERPLRRDFVYEIRVATAGESFFPSEAYYTLRRIPTDATR